MIKNTNDTFSNENALELGKLVSIDLNTCLIPQLSYDSLAGGTFSPGHTITDSPGNTAIITSDDGVTLVLNTLNVTSAPAFVLGDTITDVVGGVTATITTTLNWVGTEIEIPIVGGQKYAIFEAVFTNASVSLDTVQDIEIWDGALRTGWEIMSTKNLSALVTPVQFLEVYYGGPFMGPATQVTTTDSVFLSFGTPQGAPATCDVYVYGYIL